jgi:hypothetical protein
MNTEKTWVSLGYAVYIIFALAIILKIGYRFFAWIFSGQIFLMPLLNTIILFAFLINLAYAFYWMLKWDDYTEKKYPDISKKQEYKGSYRLRASIWWLEIIKNSHPEDKIYSKYIKHCRIVGILLLAQFLSFYLLSLVRN